MELTLEENKTLEITLEENKIIVLNEEKILPFRKLNDKGIKEQEVKEQRLREGKDKIRVAFLNGEYLRGYRTQGYAANLLKQEKVAKDIKGWGTLVDSALVSALGEEFTFTDVLKYVKHKGMKKFKK